MTARGKRSRRFPILAALLLLLTLLTAAITIRSRTHGDRLSIANMGFFIDQGVTGFAVYNEQEEELISGRLGMMRPIYEEGHRTWKHSPSWYWLWWKWGPDDVSRFSAMFPAWPIPLLLGCMSGLLFIRWIGRVRTGRCVKCGYDLRKTTPDVPCPECGHTLTVAQTTS